MMSAETIEVVRKTQMTIYIVIHIPGNTLTVVLSTILAPVGILDGQIVGLVDSLDDNYFPSFIYQ